MISRIHPAPLKRRGINLISLGCPRNLVDSQVIAGRLKTKGAKIVDIDRANTVIINTCAFIKEAKEESIEVILDAIELKKQGRIKKILIFGCLSQRYPEELLKEFSSIDAVVGRLGLENSKSRLLLTPAHYAYLKVCEGCFNNCSFCVIPKIKGRFRSKDQESVLDEVRFLDKKNITELNIIGQDITCFGLDSGPKPRLTDLVYNILGETYNIKWFRLLYLNPLRIDKNLIELMKQSQRICKYIDLPIQHINNRILRLMNRHITKEQILSQIKWIRTEIPQVAIRTSVIVGFPTETEDEFKELIDFIEQVRFERLGAFIYSQEEGTSAYSFSGQVPEATKRKRFDILMRKQQEIAQDINSSLVGKVMDVMIEESKDNMPNCPIPSGRRGEVGYIGRTQKDAPEVDGSVFVRSEEKLSVGDIVKVKITGAYEYDLDGEKTPS